MARRVKTTPRKKPRQARSRATVDAILEATAHVLVVDGYDQTSTNRVARRAGVSVGSVYQYFPNKEALVGELLDRYSQPIVEMLLERLEASAEEPPERVVPQLVRAMVQLKRDNPKLARVLREQIPRVGRMQRYERHLADIVEAAERYLEGWRERLRDVDPRVAAFLAVHTVDAVTHAAICHGGEVEDALLEREVADLVLGYLVVDRGAS